MPPKSRKQAGLMGADLARAREGKPTKTGMSESQLSEYLSGSHVKKLPEKKKG